MKYQYATAPELFFKNHMNEKSDLWSLGIILYILLFKRYPWAGKNSDEYFNNISKFDAFIPEN